MVNSMLNKVHTLRLPLVLSLSVLFLLVSACQLPSFSDTPKPETPKQSLALAEISFTELVSKLNVNKHLLDEGKLAIARTTVASVSVALDAAQAALDKGLMDKFENTLLEIAEGISKVEELLKQVE